MIKKILLVLCLLFLFYAPFPIIEPIRVYYDGKEAIAKKYECYPVESCKADFNGDGKADIFTIADEPNEVFKHYYYLKIYVEENNQKKEILKIRYDLFRDNSRTHIAIVERYDQKELIIFDPINKEQFFIWDGSRLSPLWNGKELSFENERAINERWISQAMGLGDVEGGLIEKKAIFTMLWCLFGLYYFVLSGSIGLFLYYSKTPKIKMI